MKPGGMSKTDRCQFCRAGLDPENPMTHYKCGWPIKPFKYLDIATFHRVEKAIAAGKPW
jgi:hypothetical protein